jgi:hypothetical protein
VSKSEYRTVSESESDPVSLSLPYVEVLDSPSVAEPESAPVLLVESEALPETAPESEQAWVFESATLSESRLGVESESLSERVSGGDLSGISEMASRPEPESLSGGTNGLIGLQAQKRVGVTRITSATNIVHKNDVVLKNNRYLWASRFKNDLSLFTHLAPFMVHQ